MNAFKYEVDKTMCEFSAHVASDKATNGQTDIKHVLVWKTLSRPYKKPRQRAILGPTYSGVSWTKIYFSVG